jgi:hypothetical protein
MAGLIFILPVLAFDVWLLITTGRKQVRLWRENKKWRPLALAVGIGLVLAIALPAFVPFGTGPRGRMIGFPIPLVFLTQDDKQQMTRTTLTGALWFFGILTDVSTGLAAPFIPFKVADFLKAVKAEMK